MKTYKPEEISYFRSTDQLDDNERFISVSHLEQIIDRWESSNKNVNLEEFVGTELLGSKNTPDESWNLLIKAIQKYGLDEALLNASFEDITSIEFHHLKKSYLESRNKLIFCIEKNTGYSFY